MSEPRAKPGASRMEAAGVELDGSFKTGLFAYFLMKMKFLKHSSHSNVWVQVQNRYTAFPPLTSLVGAIDR